MYSRASILMTDLPPLQLRRTTRGVITKVGRRAARGVHVAGVRMCWIDWRMLKSPVLLLCPRRCSLYPTPPPSTLITCQCSPLSMTPPLGPGRLLRLAHHSSFVALRPHPLFPRLLFLLSLSLSLSLPSFRSTKVRLTVGSGTDPHKMPARDTLPTSSGT